MTIRCGMTVTLRIEGVAFGGAGVGRHENMAVFVPFTAPGDEVAVTVTAVKRRYARGELREIVTASPSRVPPRCPYFTRCGGCDYQHLPYAEQLAIKEGQVREIFRRLGGFPEPPVAAIIPSPRPFHYRGKGDFCLRRERGKTAAGFLRAGSHEFVEIESCAIVHETINDALAALRRTGDGKTRRRGLQKLSLWSHPETLPDAPSSEDHQSSSYVRREVLGKTILVSRDGFFQANLCLTGRLVEEVAALCALTGRETLVDAYGGSGLFSLFLGPAARRIVGIELQEAAVRCARLNLERQGLANGAFVAGDAAAVLQEMFVRPGKKLDVLLLDPPRNGCGHGVLEAAARLGPSRIVYVSCNPATLARDCRFLAASGYRLRHLQPLDMFPQTAHIESVCLLQRAERIVC